jgi:S-adenosylmethionine hydrolase
VVETSCGYFVGPDNGIFTLVYEREAVQRTLAIENPRFMRPTVSRTFHGRDVFAPAAAYLSLGVPVELFGSPVEGGEVVAFPRARVTEDGVEGEVIHIDRFGNLITNISVEMVESLAGSGTRWIQVAGHKVGGPYGSYEEGDEGEAFGIFGSSELLEISMKRRRAHEMLGVDRGAVIRVLRGGVEA